MTPRELAARLRRIDFSAVQHAALADQSALIATAVREAVSQPPGTEPHAYPWLRTGELRDSIGTKSSESEAVVGAASPTALYQEHGTPTVPPRPFLAPVAALHAGDAARSVAASIVATLKCALEDH